MSLKSFPSKKDYRRSLRTSLISQFLFNEPIKKEFSSFGTVLFDKKITNLIHCPITATGKYVIPDSVESIGIEAFAQCKGITELILPAKLKTIGCSAFQNCTGLTTVLIPNSLEEMGYRIFSNCTGLKSILMQADSPIEFAEELDIFHNVNKDNVTLYVPFGTKGNYRMANQWKEFKKIVESDILPDCLI